MEVPHQFSGKLKKEKRKATVMWWFIPAGSLESLLLSTSVLPVVWGREFIVLIYIFTNTIDAQCSCSPSAGQCPARPQAAAAPWPISHGFSKFFFFFFLTLFHMVLDIALATLGQLSYPSSWCLTQPSDSSV